MDADTIKTSRKLLNMTQQQFGDALGYSRFAVLNWENGSVKAFPDDLGAKIMALTPKEPINPVTEAPERADFAPLGITSLKEGVAKGVKHYHHTLRPITVAEILLMAATRFILYLMTARLGLCSLSRHGSTSAP